MASESYNKRNEYARELGYRNYYDQRTSRSRARGLLRQLGDPDANEVDKDSLGYIDELAQFGRGMNRLELEDAFREWLGEQGFDNTISDSDLWEMIRSYYGKGKRGKK